MELPMFANYVSQIYDLTTFGIFNIKNAIVSSDMDNNIIIEVSFNGGGVFHKVDKLNTKFEVPVSTGKIQVRITFEDVPKDDIYMMKSTGFFQNLGVGTTINFTKTSTNKTFSTTIGRNGQYFISLPRGKYTVWYKSNGQKETLMTNYNPEITYTPTYENGKQAIIENTFADIDWARFSVFDTFVDNSKMLNGSAIIDTQGNLSDGKTNRKCRYWAVGFE